MCETNNIKHIIHIKTSNICYKQTYDSYIIHKQSMCGYIWHDTLNSMGGNLMGQPSMNTYSYMSFMISQTSFIRYEWRVKG